MYTSVHDVNVVIVVCVCGHTTVVLVDRGGQRRGECGWCGLLSQSYNVHTRYSGRVHESGISGTSTYSVHGLRYLYDPV